MKTDKMREQGKKWSSDAVRRSAGDPAPLNDASAARILGAQWQMIAEVCDRLEWIAEKVYEAGIRGGN